MQIQKIIIQITIPIFLLMLFASFLTTKGYLLLSEGLYESHEEITFDHQYVSDRIMGYLNYRYDDLNIGPNQDSSEPLFRDIEIRHMVDVKNLYTSLRLVALGSLVIGLGLSYNLYKKDKNTLYETYMGMYVGPVLFIFVVGGYMLIDFGKAFTVFHQLFFTNDDWQLYSTDALIQLLPLNFWLVSATIILLLFASSLAIIHFVFRKKWWKNRT